MDGCFACSNEKNFEAHLVENERSLSGKADSCKELGERSISYNYRKHPYFQRASKNDFAAFFVYLLPTILALLFNNWNANAYITDSNQALEIESFFSHLMKRQCFGINRHALAVENVLEQAVNII